jgi:hypothetical protein
MDPPLGACQGDGPGLRFGFRNAIFLSWFLSRWRLSPLFYEDVQIFIFPAPIICLGEENLPAAGEHPSATATPDFLSRLVALADFMRLSLRKAARVGLVKAGKQKIRVRSGPTASRGRRDDKVEGGVRG